MHVGVKWYRCPGREPATARVPEDFWQSERNRKKFLFWVMYIIPLLYIMGVGLREKCRLDPLLYRVGRKVFWPFSGPLLGVGRKIGTRAVLGTFPKTERLGQLLVIGSHLKHLW